MKFNQTLVKIEWLAPGDTEPTVFMCEQASMDDVTQGAAAAAVGQPGDPARASSIAQARIELCVRRVKEWTVEADEGDGHHPCTDETKREFFSRCGSATMTVASELLRIGGGRGNG